MDAESSKLPALIREALETDPTHYDKGVGAGLSAAVAGILNRLHETDRPGTLDQVRVNEHEVGILIKAADKGFGGLAPIITALYQENRVGKGAGRRPGLDRD